MNAPPTQEQQEAAYLSRLGERVRAWRTEHGMTRKTLSEASGISERYLAQLESGQGNISVLLLRKVARAIGAPVERLLDGSPSSGCAAPENRRLGRSSRRAWAFLSWSSTAKSRKRPGRSSAKCSPCTARTRSAASSAARWSAS
jgi:transcriptional regulator with XRE-family HTH domain